MLFRSHTEPNESLADELQAFNRVSSTVVDEERALQEQRDHAHVQSTAHAAKQQGVDDAPAGTEYRKKGSRASKAHAGTEYRVHSTSAETALAGTEYRTGNDIARASNLHVSPRGDSTRSGTGPRVQDNDRIAHASLHANHGASLSEDTHTSSGSHGIQSLETHVHGAHVKEAKHSSRDEKRSILGGDSHEIGRAHV